MVTFVNETRTYDDAQLSRLNRKQRKWIVGHLGAGKAPLEIAQLSFKPGDSVAMAWRVLCAAYALKEKSCQSH